MLKIVLDPTSSIAAIQLEDHDNTLYLLPRLVTTDPFHKGHTLKNYLNTDPNTDFLRMGMVNQRRPRKP